MRVSATTLESFRLYCEPDQEWMTEEDLRASIQGIFTPNPRIQLGSAWGRILEHPARFKVPGGYRVEKQSDHPWDRPVFVPDLVLAEALPYVDHRRGVFEAKAAQSYGAIDVVSKADMLLGSRLYEFKSPTSGFDPDKYAESYQWRFMVDAFEPSLVTYLVFCLFIPTRNDEWCTNGDGAWQPRLEDIHEMNLYPYPGLRRDCQDLVHRFADYVRQRELAEVLEARQHANIGGLEWAL